MLFIGMLACMLFIDTLLVLTFERCGVINYRGQANK